MEKTRSQLITRKSKLIILACLSFVMFYVFTYMLNPYDVWWVQYFARPVTDIFTEWALSLISCTLIAVSSISIHEQLNQKLPWIETPLRRLVVETSINVGSVVLLIFSQLIVMYLLEEECTQIFGDNKENLWYWQWLTVSIFIALTISAINTGDYLILNWKNAALEATEHKLKSAQHKQAATEAELEALKLQLDPHFVFNNLSVLSELILEDQQLGYQYSENFSKVYRYLLLNSRKDLITLADEMKFLRAYIFLLKHRAGSGITFEINIDPAQLNLHLPPMTLQLLIENAMKHNKFLKSNPLQIIVTSGPNDDLIVSNSIIPLQKKKNSPGLGLQNIIQRYLLLTDRRPQITTTDAMFTVEIPLIKS
ncbi:sensor histidine kinase [Dyadobacter sp. CY312]|uniref:sensor histidine kinase n=1 Tax=Dyadobacter sp. CY312 TaxID=2907303 RepID=UPI001F271A77|nr:histidine kinase [Dyadobacter sp. CY312]MCE7043191.1 histidine kinase [Dyadobacter sp. CY312]